MLNQILEKHNKLDTIEKMQSTMKSEADESGRLISEKMVVTERSLALSVEIPRLLNQVTVVEEVVNALEAEQAKIKLDQVLASGAGPSSPSPAVSALNLETIQQLRDSNARMRAQLDNVTQSQAKFWAELVISGLIHFNASSLRLLACVALKPLDEQLKKRDILFRPLEREKRRIAQEEAIADPVDDPAASAVFGAAIVPLVVSLFKPLIHSLISAKLELRKLHIIQLPVDILRKASTTVLLLDSYINVNA